MPNLTIIKSVFIDTWGWLALSHRRDQHHLSVKALYLKLRQSNAQIYTSDYVLEDEHFVQVGLGFIKIIEDSGGRRG